MNWLRLCFVLMLVVLLPLRGAVAAAMLCPPATAMGTVTMQEALEATGAHAHHHEDHHGEASQHGPSHSVQDGKCNLCAASCSLTTLLGDTPSVAEPPVTTAAAFPALSAPAPSFLSSGQERPPRSI